MIFTDVTPAGTVNVCCFPVYLKLLLLAASTCCTRLGATGNWEPAQLESSRAPRRLLLLDSP